MEIYISPYASEKGEKEGTNAAPTEWTTVCHQSRDFLWINYKGTRETSRWVSVERKLPYLVERKRKGSYGSGEISAHKTLAAAIKAAGKFAQEHQS